MFRSKKLFNLLIFLIILSLMFSSAAVGQKKSKKQHKKQPNLQAYGKPVMWEPVNISEQDLFYGPGGRAINPITKTNWEGVGVKPDVRVPGDQALTKAIELIAARPSCQSRNIRNASQFDGSFWWKADINGHREKGRRT